MTARNTTKLSNTAKAVEQVTQAQDQAQAQDEVNARNDFFSAFNIYLMGLGQAPAASPIPTTKRLIIAFIASVATFAVGVTAGMFFATWLSNVVFFLGFGAFISIVVYLMAYLISVLAATYAAGWVARYIATGSVVDDMNSAAGWLSAKLSGASSYVKGSLAAKRAASTL